MLVMPDATPSATMLADRAVIRVVGDDVRGFLQGLVTNDVAGILPVYAGLLTPQGKALFDFIIWADGDNILIDCEGEQAEGLVRRLSLYRLRRPITIAVDPGLAVHWSGDIAQGTPDPHTPDPHAPDPRAPDPRAPDPRNADLGHRWIASPADAAQNWHAHRLSLGIVEGAAELGQDKTLWLETNAREQNGVSFTKGCYIGQENTARMHHREKVNRRLAVVAADTEPAEARAWYPQLKRAVIVQK
jgi:tRNA-modifying protein YgfZ